MRLLIVTQKVDRQDPILGFFHRWIEEFAKKCESVIVIGQMVGEHNLPANVTVLSLGKERGSWRIVQILRYRWMLFTHRREYDAIFVHMTPIWAVCAWRMTVFFRKPIYLWYEARGARWPLTVSLWLARKVFSASKSGMPVETTKSVITGHGIDTDTFSFTNNSKRDPLVMTVGRITASKRLNLIIDAFVQLQTKYKLYIVGSTVTNEDERLLKELLSSTEKIKERVLLPVVTINELVPTWLQHADLFLHASSTSLDKALLEAMACGCLVVSCSDAAREVLPPECLASAEGMAERVKALLGLPEAEQNALRHKLRDIVVRHHSLTRLIQRLVEEMAM